MLNRTRKTVSLSKYKKSIQQLKKCANKLGVSDEEFNELYQEYLTNLENELPYSAVKWYYNLPPRRYLVFLLVAIISLFFLSSCKGVYSIIFCNMQELIYPGLKLLRKLSIPLITIFPSLTELYDETCLIQNPFFRVVDMDCWPCSTVNSVYETQEPEEFAKQNSIPFIYRTNQSLVDWTDLSQMYENHKSVFDKDAPKVLFNGKSWMKPETLFSNLKSKDRKLVKKFMWRTNRIGPAQVLRQVFPRPAIVPYLGQSTERFVIVDFNSDTYELPDPDCNFVFIIQSKGQRIIELKPAKECVNRCKPVSILLKESYLLWYNWWYWRPVSHPTSNNMTSVAHMGSYC